MSFTEKIDVLELLLSLLKENEEKLENIIEKIEIVEHTVTQNSGLVKSLKEYDSSTSNILGSQNILVVYQRVYHRQILITEIYHQP